MSLELADKLLQLSLNAQVLFGLVPEIGSIGNITLRKQFNAQNANMPEEWLSTGFSTTKAELLAAGLIGLGRGKGGSVYRISDVPLSAASPVSEQISVPDATGTTEEF